MLNFRQFNTYFFFKYVFILFLYLIFNVFLSLQDNFDEYDDDEENCYIPQEVVLEYQCQREKVEQQRRELRETLKENFARLCKQLKNSKQRNINSSQRSTSGPSCI